MNKNYFEETKTKLSCKKSEKKKEKKKRRNEKRNIVNCCSNLLTLHLVWHKAKNIQTCQWGSNSLNSSNGQRDFPRYFIQRLSLQVVGLCFQYKYEDAITPDFHNEHTVKSISSDGDLKFPLVPFRILLPINKMIDFFFPRFVSIRCTSQRPVFAFSADSQVKSDQFSIVRREIRSMEHSIK